MAGVPSPAGGQNLRAAIATQAAPPNPLTPKDRKDPREETLLDQQRIRRAFEVAKDHLMDGDPLEGLYGAMHAAVTRLRDGTPIEDVTDAMALATWQLATPQMKTRLLQEISPAPQPGGMGANAGPGAASGAPGIGPGMPVPPVAPAASAGGASPPQSLGG